MKIAEVTVTNEYSLASWGRKSTELKQTRECTHTNNNSWWAKREPAAVDTAGISDGQGMLDMVLFYQGRQAPRICLNLLLSTSSFFFPWSHQHLNWNLTLKTSKTWLLISALPLQIPSLPSLCPILTPETKQLPAGFPGLLHSARN